MTAAECTRGCTLHNVAYAAVQIARLSMYYVLSIKWEFTALWTWHLRELLTLYAIPAPSHQISGPVGWQAYTDHFSKQKSEIYLNILEEDADNSTELMLEERISAINSSWRLKFSMHNLIWLKSRDRLLSLSLSLSIQSCWWITIELK